MKKFLLVLAVLASLAPVTFAAGRQGSTGTTDSGAIPAYINLDGYFPIVKHGTDISMTVSWLPDQAAVHSDPSQIWYFSYVREAFNIDLKVTPRAPGSEVKNLMFASGDLPDIWMNDISPNDIVNYGVSEKMIMPITRYINPVLMPRLSKVHNDDPSLVPSSMAPDGNIYGFPNYRSKTLLHGPITGGLSRLFINKKWLDQLNLKVPETLDQYLAMLREFKSMRNDILPDSGIFRGNNNFSLIFSALGFHWTGNHNITSVGTRNGKATFIYGDREIYPKFLETYNTMYKEGLITSDFFTMDNNTRTAITMAGNGGVLAASPNTSVALQYQFDYVSVKPLTSELNSKIFWVGPNNYVQPNLVVLTSRCKTPEAACRMYDYNFDEMDYMYVMQGYPENNPKWNLGMDPGWRIGINDNQVTYQWTPTLHEQGIYVVNRIRPVNGTVGILGNLGELCKRIYGLDPPKEDWNPANPDSFVRQSTYENLSLHAVIEFPFTVYWDVKTTQRLSDLSPVINDFANIQFAQFVTGQRPLSQINDYFAELDRLNFQEYLKYYQDYYEKIKTEN